MNAFYQIAITITDTEKFQEYLNLAGPLVEKFGGRILARGQKFTDFTELIAIIGFTTMDQAIAWHTSKEYQELVPIRNSGAITKFTLFETL